MKTERPILIYQKNVEKTTQKIKLPKHLVENWGYEYYMEIYSNKIVLIPIKLKNEEEKVEE
jgi:hypothetical protein